MALHLLLNLLLALLLSLLGSYVVLSSHRKPNAWVWGAVFGAAVSLTMMKSVTIEPGWVMDFRAVVMALSGFAGGTTTFIASAVIGSLYRLHVGGGGAMMGVVAIFAFGLVGAHLGRRYPARNHVPVVVLLFVGLVLAVLAVALMWMGSVMSPQGTVMTWPLALLLLVLMPPSTLIAFHCFFVVRAKLMEHVIIEAAASVLPAVLVVSDARGRVLATNKGLNAQELSRLPLGATTEHAVVAARKYLISRQSWCVSGVECGSLVSLDDVTAWHDALAQLRNFFELALEALLILGPQDEVLQSNGAALLHGLRRSVRLTDIVHPDDRELTLAKLQATRRPGAGCTGLEHRCVGEDGTVRWLVWSCVAAARGGYIYAVGRDVTKDKEHLNAVRAQTALLTEQVLFLELAHDAVIVRDLDGKITFWNSGAERTYGFARSEALGAQYHTLLSGSYPRPASEIEAELTVSNDWQGEIERFHRDGTMKLIRCHWVLKRDEQMRPAAVLEVSRDITEQERARQTTAHLAALVEQSRDAIISTDLAGRILTGNGATEKLLRCDLNRIVGQSVLSLVRPEHRGALRQALDGVCQDGASRRANLSLCDCVGDAVPSSVTLSRMQNRRGDATGLSFILRDLTAKQARDREITRLDRLGLASQLATGIGHEVRNPLTTIRGFLQLFCMRPDLSRYTDQFKLLIGALDRMNETLTDFLTLARNRIVENKDTDLNAVIRASLGLFAADAREAMCRLEVELMDVPLIAANERALRQLLANLVRNALEASPAGGAVVIRTAVKAMSVVLSVSDQGTGIPPDVLAQMGTPLFTTKPDGTGLGLTVCQAIVEQHGGTMTFDHGEHGTTFYVTFPVLPVEPKPPCLSAGK